MAVEYNRSENARREYTVHGRRSEMGKTRIEIKCPFCGDHSWAYVWSLSGGGKKCENKKCGAKFDAYGGATPVAGRENGPT